jgi:hypothetical protein
MTLHDPPTWLVPLLTFFGGGLFTYVGHYIKRRLDNTAEFKQRRAAAVAKMWGSLALAFRSFKALTPVADQASYAQFAQRAQDAANTFRDTLNENLIYLPAEPANLFQTFWSKLLSANVYVNSHTQNHDEKLFAARADLESLETRLLPWCMFLVGDPDAKRPKERA